MDKKYKIRNSREFRVVYDKGNSKANRLLVLFYINNGKDYNRVGFSVTKKLGNSVVRNKVKRLIKEGFRANSENIKSGYDLVFLSRIKANEASYEEMDSAVSHLIRICGLKKNK